MSRVVQKKMVIHPVRKISIFPANHKIADRIDGISVDPALSLPFGKGEVRRCL
jgi:hypothetical protein